MTDRELIVANCTHTSLERVLVARIPYNRCKDCGQLIDLNTDKPVEIRVLGKS